MREAIFGNDLTGRSSDASPPVKGGCPKGGGVSPPDRTTPALRATPPYPRRGIHLHPSPAFWSGLCQQFPKMLLLAALTLGGCAAVGPDYQRPEVPVPAQWRLADGEMQAVANPGWWRQFQDPVLDQLVEIALQENKDLKIASARIEEFLGRYAFTRADQFPQLGAEVGGDRTRTPPGVSPTDDSTIRSLYQASALLSFELDLFGRLRRATEAAQAELLATEEAQRTVILALVTAVAGNYVQLRALDQQLATSRQTLETRAESLRIARLRFQAGLTSELDARQAEAEYYATAVQIPQLELAIAQRENALSLLLGRNPGTIARGRALDALVRPPVPAGVPSELLERRPDLRQAEQTLIAANANIGVARAAYFPVISLTGLFGYVSPQLEDLFQGPARAWNYGGILGVPIFTAGRIAGQVQAAEAVQQQALAGYEKAIQTAFAEVEDSLIALRKNRERVQAQEAQLAALRRSLRLARLRYDNGLVSFIEVIDAERNLFDVELTFAQSQSDVLLALIDLYKALGGGWVEEAELRVMGELQPKAG
jgi:outer membrane protein, multidrug efflux system